MTDAPVVDGAVGSLDTLPGIVDAVSGRMPVLFDSGVRTGAEVFRALALGAAAVLVRALAEPPDEGARPAVLLELGQARARIGAP